MTGRRSGEGQLRLSVHCVAREGMLYAETCGWVEAIRVSCSRNQMLIMALLIITYRHSWMPSWITHTHNSWPRSRTAGMPLCTIQTYCSKPDFVRVCMCIWIHTGKGSCPESGRKEKKQQHGTKGAQWELKEPPGHKQKRRKKTKESESESRLLICLSLRLSVTSPVCFWVTGPFGGLGGTGMSPVCIFFLLWVTDT